MNDARALAARMRADSGAIARANPFSFRHLRRLAANSYFMFGRDRASQQLDRARLHHGMRITMLSNFVVANCETQFDEMDVRGLIS